MGYTHYWTQTRDLTPPEMGDIAASVRRIIAEAEGKQTTTAGGYCTEPVQICGGDGTGKPILSKQKICFNGNGPNLDHETFYFEPKRSLPYDGARPDQFGWAFCKTARKPYDVVVVACLTFLAVDYGFRVSSDGDHTELQAGVDLCCKALGREYPHPLTVEIMRPARVA